MTRFLATGAILLFLSVGLGAFGAHGLKGRLVELGTLAVYEKAVLYHMLHAIGLLIVPLIASQSFIAEAHAQKICWLLAAGILIFSGSLYILAITNIKWLGAITPFGGLSFLAAWALLAFGLIRQQ